MTFLKSFGAWAGFICSPGLIIVSRGPRPHNIAQVKDATLLLLPLLLIPAIGSLILWSPVFSRDTSGKGMLAGVLLGIFVPILLGLVWMQIYAAGFASGPLIFLGSPLIAAPSAVVELWPAGCVRGRIEDRTSGASILPRAFFWEEIQESHHQTVFNSGLLRIRSSRVTKVIPSARAVAPIKRATGSWG